MPLYLYACPEHGAVQVRHSMDEVGSAKPCPDCGAQSTRIFTVPQYNPDNTRFFRNPVNGTRFSYHLGREMPETRSEYKSLCDKMGIEPVTSKTMPEQWKQDQEYLQHVRNGGERDTATNTDISRGPKVKDMLRESNVRIG